MNNTTNSVAGSLTRHSLTAGGVAGLISAQDELIKLVSLVVTIIGLAWSIWEKVSRKNPPAVPPAVLLAFSLLPSALLLTGCGSTGHVGSSYNPATGDLGANAGVGNTNYTVDVGGSYNVETGQLGPITLTVSFKDAPNPGVASILADAGAVPQSAIRNPQSFVLTVPNLRDPNSPQFIALRAALAAGATITRQD